jgi:hypothetical protein
MTDPTPASLQLVVHEAPMGGAMLALPLPADLHERMGVAKPAKPLHVTLLYLGKAARITPELARALVHATREVCERWEPLEGYIGNRLGSFPAGPDGAVPHWASVELTAARKSDQAAGTQAEVASIHELRADLKDAIIAAGFPFEDTYPDYHPHGTLAFAPAGAPGPAFCRSAHVRVEMIELAHGADASDSFDAARAGDAAAC